ncbi:MAG: AAA family ATPase [Chlamydiota bacterium]
MFLKRERLSSHREKQEKSFFLARPRRFGKSLFVSTLAEILRGNKELFDGLWIADSEYEWPVFGVIHLDLGPIKSLNAGTVERFICQILLNVAQDYGISLETDFTDPNTILVSLARALHEKFKK